MKTFQEFLSEDAAADTSSTISRGVVGGGSDTFGKAVDRSFKKRPKTGLGAYLKDKFKNRDKDKPEKEKPGRDTSYRGQGTGRKDTVSKAKPAAGPSSKGRSLPAGKERPALPAGKDSMVAKRVAAAKQTPQHKQISARPASTAMAGSRQRPAIRPAKSNLSRDNMGVQDVKVQDHGPNPQKRLNPAKSNRQLPPAKSNLSRDNMGVQKVNVQDLGPTTQKRLNPAKSNRQLPAARNTQRQLPPGR